MGIRLLLDTMLEILEEDPDFLIFTPENIGNNIPDLILVDYQSLTPLVKAKYPQSKLVLIDTGIRDEQVVVAVGSYNLAGVIATYTDVPLLKKALKVIMEGQIWLDNRLLKSFMHESPKSIKRAPVALSEKEKLIIQHICQGLTNKEIASKLNLSEQTIKTHVNRIFKKLGLSNRFQLVSLFSDSENVGL